MINIVTHKKLTLSERQLISKWLIAGVAKKECARRLGRDIKTIRRELSRNQTRVSVGKDWEVIYEPLHAQAVAMQRKQRAFSAKLPLKNQNIYAYVIDYLRQGWSPEQISGRLREVDHIGEKDWQICKETIYAFIYKPKTDMTKWSLIREAVLDKRKIAQAKGMITLTDHEKPLWEYLRRKQKKRRKLGGRKVHRVRIPDRISIHERPKVIEKRLQFGHWEGDSVEGKGHKTGLHTEYERVSSLTRFERLGRITAEQVVQAALAIFDSLPAQAKLSTTLDNGSEHVKHREFGIQVYFADPYSAYQRGGNENANLWIRYYFPKGTDFATISDEELSDVEWELNNRPRKRLKFETPQEVFDSYLNK